MKIHVMGPGCPKCTLAAKNVEEAVAESGIDAEIVKITDFQEIASFGVFSTPAVAVDGVIKVSGKAPSVKEIASWLK